MVAPSQPIIGKASKDKDVMGAMRQKKTGKQAENVKLDMIQIIEASVRKEMPNVDPKRAIVGVSMVTKKGGKLVQIGNTVFLVMPQPDGSAEFHTFTVEPVDTLIKRYRSGMNTAKQMGFKKLISYTNKPEFLKIAKDTGLPVKISQSQQMVNKQMVPAYKFEVDL
jgi:hypothetical protein